MQPNYSLKLNRYGCVAGRPRAATQFPIRGQATHTSAVSLARTLGGTKYMRAYIFAVCILALSPSLAALPRGIEQPAKLLGCVAPEKLSCGCYVRIREFSCTKPAASNAPNLFTGLESKDPLVLRLDGLDMELPHTQHQGESAKGDNPGSWTDEYRSKDLSVRITYAPGRSTCTKPKPETCEYTDYSATVSLQRSQHRTRTFKARAVCGC